MERGWWWGTGGGGRGEAKCSAHRETKRECGGDTDGDGSGGCELPVICGEVARLRSDLSPTSRTHPPAARPPPASRLHQQPCLRQVVEVSLIVHAWLHGETGIRGWAAKASAKHPLLPGHLPPHLLFFPPALCCKCKDTLSVMTSDFCCLLPPSAASPTS